MRKQKKINNIKWKQIILCYIFAFIVFSVIALIIYRNYLTEPRATVKVIVQFATTAMLLVSLALYVYYADRSVMENLRKTLAMFTTMFVSYAAILVTALWKDYGLYIVPLAMCSLILSLIVSGKCSFFANFSIIVLYFMQSINWFEHATLATEGFFYLLLSGVMQAVYASFMMGNHYRRLRYITSGLMLGLIAAVCSTVSYLVFYDNFSWLDFGIKIACSLGSGMVGVMLMFVLVPLFEKIFNVASVFRFSEIATSDNELMRKLFEKAPGTYNHSLSVATYVEACAMAIGQSAVMARAAAYYHDIGKMKNPTYYVENQFSGVNPHDSMTPEASVNVLKSHPLNGLAIAKDYRLPKEVQEAIMEHHGTLPIKYFYWKAQKYTDGELSYDGYCYDGPKPQSKISAILMICDASEAALRAQGEHGDVEKIVDSIVNERIAFDQFSECDITMKELDIIKSTIITTFTGIRHKRVSYPDVKLTGKD